MDTSTTLELPQLLPETFGRRRANSAFRPNERPIRSGSVTVDFMKQSKRRISVRLQENARRPSSASVRPASALTWDEKLQKLEKIARSIVEKQRETAGNSDYYADHAESTPSSSGSGKGKFKTVAQLVKQQVEISKDLAKDAEFHLKKMVPTYCCENGEALTFNVNSFRPDVQACRGLPDLAKSILMKPSWARTEDDVKFLHVFTMRLKWFDKYSLYVRKELSRILYYEAYEAGRVLVRQGDPGFSFYIIVNGSVFVEVLETDPLSGRKQYHIVNELGPGDSFGELALLHDAVRNATIVCKEYTELMTVDKPDFEKILKKNYEHQWNVRMKFFKQHPLFAGWDPRHATAFVQSSQIVDYEARSLIMRDISEPSDDVYFVLTGTCKAIQKRKSRLHGVEQWWLLRTLHVGDYFGLGENQKNTSIVSDFKVQCLVVKKIIFLKHKGGKCLQQMEANANKLYPTTDTALEGFITNLKWNSYKRKVTSQAVAKKKNPQTWYDFQRIHFST